MTPVIGTTTWSTDSIDERERFSFWREMVCRNVFNISVQAPPKRFSASITARSHGALRFAICESTAYDIDRTQKDISNESADHYLMYLQLRGHTLLTQANDAIEFGRNDIVIADGRRPYHAALFDDGQCRRQAIAVLPRSFIEARAPWLRRRPVFKLASNSVYVDLTRRHLLQLTADDLTEGELALLTENLCNLLALLDHADTPINRVQPELQLEALLDFCRRNLHDPALSPDFVAAQFGISTRTLHLRFEKLEQTFGRWLLDARLDASSNALRNPQQHACSISEIAYNSGFNDLSHFNKSFRARFGASPSEWRADFLKR
jgi:AraC family transcriptional regulator, positive regulator of tynA and feaB